MLSCLGDSAYKIFLSSYRRVAHAMDDWCNKGRGMCYPVWGIVHIKYSLVLIGEWPMQWTTGVTKVVVCVILSGG